MVKRVSVNPEIHCIYVDLPENPLRVLNVYVIRSQGQSVIIDTGFNRPECHDAFWTGIAELELDLLRTSLFLTHLHSDHTGLVWSLVEKGIPVYMSRVDHELLNDPNGVGRLILDDRFLREGYPAEELALQRRDNQGRRYAPKLGFPVIPVEDGRIFSLGSIKIKAILTPGHTPGHMVLYLPQYQILFSGDHILFDITPNISIWGENDHSLKDYISSLLKIRTVPILTVFPAHRKTAPDVYQRIGQLIWHHGYRLNEIYEAVRDFPGSTAFELSGHISWSVRGLGWEKFPPHQKWFAVSETLAHLDYLMERGQIYRDSDSELVRYYPVGFYTK